MSDVIFGTKNGKKSLTLSIQYIHGQEIPSLTSETADGFTKHELQMLVDYLQHFIDLSNNQNEIKKENL